MVSTQVEVAFIYARWTAWRVPICLSVRGAFHHAGYGAEMAATA